MAAEAYAADVTTLRYRGVGLAGKKGSCGPAAKAMRRNRALPETGTLACLINTPAACEALSRGPLSTEYQPACRVC